MERVLICVKEENDDDGESRMLLGVLFVGGTLFTIFLQGEFLDVVQRLLKFGVVGEY